MDSFLHTPAEGSPGSRSPPFALGPTVAQQAFRGADKQETRVPFSENISSLDTFAHSAAPGPQPCSLGIALFAL